MDYMAINNLDRIVQLKYKCICLHHTDLWQFLLDPLQKEKFYPVKDMSAYNKKGFFNSGQTMVWISSNIKKNHVKISDIKIPIGSDSNEWSDTFCFSEFDSAIKISKIMKLKVFW